jgi:predicted DNA-binding protein (UPF0251 family)
MPRPKRIRRMNNPPHFKGFKPIGLSGDHPVIINYEEYEAIRLSDFELFSQVEGAQMMGVSRPTYARIYESARRKVAQSFVQGRPIVFEGGKVYFDSEWYTCKHCGCWFNHLAKEEEVTCCALCGSSQIEQYTGEVQQNAAEDGCICPCCGVQKSHTPGIPCKKDICPECGSPMIRKGSPQHHGIRTSNC